ncbi:hypothetical protein HDV02_004597 [Globomyces sp. JEL0801]|nr:hypothetical protein HDV02_004597 [Globomyces sp. JEL0801]
MNSIAQPKPLNCSLLLHSHPSDNTILPSRSTKRSHKSVPVRSFPQGSKDSQPGYIITLGFGVESGRIVRSVNYQDPLPYLKRNQLNHSISVSSVKPTPKKSTAIQKKTLTLGKRRRGANTINNTLPLSPISPDESEKPRVKRSRNSALPISPTVKTNQRPTRAVRTKKSTPNPNQDSPKTLSDPVDQKVNFNMSIENVSEQTLIESVVSITSSI